MSEPTFHTRRKFLRTGVLGGAAAWTIPAFLEKTFFAMDAAAADSATQIVTGKDSPILVIVQMAGGNDGLNMVVPYADDAYHIARPKLAIAGDRTLKINDHLGLHPKMTGLRGLYDAGNVALIQGVGYPNPNRSHFRSTDIWQTASDSNKYERNGWLGRYFDACCEGEDPTVGISIGSQTPMAFADKSGKGITLARPEQFRFVAENAETDDAFRQMSAVDPGNDGGSVDALAGSMDMSGDSLDFVKRTALDAQISSDKILAITRKTKPSASYPTSKLANDLNLVARLIAGGLPTRVYYVSQGGYDTHSGQAGSHERLLGELDKALSAFVGDLKSQGNLDRVTVMTFSEFGRRVAENASGGTDHGAAAPMFVLGGAVHGGLYGQIPSLTKLHDGDLVHTVDFRNVYATLLDKWLRAPSDHILPRKFDPMAFI
jgi:uncharacterized protein (DUF1501 family)